MEIIRVDRTESSRELFLDALRYEGSVIPGKNPIHIIIPGGRSVDPFIGSLQLCSDALLKRIHLYLTDERLDPPSNREDLLDKGLGSLMSSGRMKPGQLHVPDTSGTAEQALRSYSSDLPASAMIIAGVGEDGHVASLFPNHRALASPEHTAYIPDSPKDPPRRITLTPHYFRTQQRTAHAFLLFFGTAKRDALSTFLTLDDPQRCPAALFKGFSTLTILTDLEV